MNSANVSSNFEKGGYLIFVLGIPFMWLMNGKLYLQEKNDAWKRFL